VRISCTELVRLAEDGYPVGDVFVNFRRDED